MRRSIVFLLVFAVAAFAAGSKTLDIYLVDVEGGNATLFVTPAGESVLIDTGNAGAAAPRIAARPRSRRTRVRARRAAAATASRPAPRRRAVRPSR